VFSGRPKPVEALKIRAIQTTKGSQCLTIRPDTNGKRLRPPLQSKREKVTQILA